MGPDGPVPDDDPCGNEAELQTYFYSMEIEGCVDTNFGGCNITRNTFLSKNDCEKIATPICKNMSLV